MKPLSSFKKWLLNILVPYIEGTNKKKKIKNESIKGWNYCRNLYVASSFLWVKKLNSKQSRQPSLSKKTIKNLKF